jgi:predicted AAA+ superfamily ATPase
VKRRVERLKELGLIRSLPAHELGFGSRLVKTPKLYVRDSGFLHALLGIVDSDDLANHSAVDTSFEGFAIECLIGAAGEGARASFYGTFDGSGIDLVLHLGCAGCWVIDVQREYRSPPKKAFYTACDLLEPTQLFVVHASEEQFSVGPDGEGVSVRELALRLARLRRSTGAALRNC